MGLEPNGLLLHHAQKAPHGIGACEQFTDADVMLQSVAILGQSQCQ